MGVKPLVLGSMKYMELLKFMTELDIQNYLVLGFIIGLMIGLIILWVKNVIMNTVLIIILEESELIRINLYLWKKCYNTH